MRLAETLGMSLSECVQQVSHREYLLWQVYLDQQWNLPSRTDHYLMQIAALVHGGKNKKLSDYQLKFKPSSQSDTRPYESQVAESKSVWGKVANEQRKRTQQRGKTDDRNRS